MRKAIWALALEVVLVALMTFCMSPVMVLVKWLRRHKNAHLAANNKLYNKRAMDEMPVDVASQYVEVSDGIQLHVACAGPEDGPVALLLHGFPECWVSWRHIIPTLVERGYRVYAPDLRGYNMSEKPVGRENFEMDRLVDDMRDLLDHFGAEKCVLVGHDWGGWILWGFCMKYQHRVHTYVVLNAPHPNAFIRELRFNWEQKLRSWYIPYFCIPYGIPELVLTNNPVFQANFIFNRHKKGTMDDKIAELVASSWSLPRTASCIMDFYRAEFLGRAFSDIFTGMSRGVKPVTVPVLVLWGEEDEALVIENTRYHKAWVSDYTLRVRAGASHWLQQEEPEWVSENIVSWLDERGLLAQPQKS